MRPRSQRRTFRSGPASAPSYEHHPGRGPCWQDVIPTATWTINREPPGETAGVMRYLESPQAGAEPSSGAECRSSIAATSFGVAGRMEGHPKAFSKQTNCFSSPSARGTWSFLERRKPPRKCRLRECSPGTTRYTLISLGEMAPTLEPLRKTLTTPPSPIAGLGRWPRPRPSPDAARTTSRVGNAGQIRFGDRHSRMVAPARSPASDVSPSLVSATTSAL